jgi:hypothetical protein
MTTLTRRSLLSAAVASLLFVGIFTPVVVFGQESASAQTQSQLMVMVAAAQSSGAYARSAIDVAASHGLSVAVAQAQLDQGDSLLAAAQADLQSGINITGGIQAVLAAMRDYTSAATLASVALTNAGLTTSAEYEATLGAIAEVNASEAAVGGAMAHACGQSGAKVSNSSAFVQTCSQATAQLSAASSHLSSASTLLVRSNGQANASADLSQAVSLVATARAEVSAAQSDLVTIASYTYAQRGRAYVSSVVGLLSSKANATIRAEESFQANLTQFQLAFGTFADSQASAIANASSSISALALAISQVDTASASASINSSESVAASVESAMSDLLALPGINILLSVVADIHTCDSAATTYDSALAAAEAQGSAFAQTSLTSFSAYIATMASDGANVQTSGSAFASSCQTVVTDLSTLLSVPGVQTVYDSLTSLGISASVSGTGSALTVENSAMASLQNAIASATSVLKTDDSTFVTGFSTLPSVSSFTLEGGAFLNATASTSLAQSVASVQSAGQAALAFASSVNSSLFVSVGFFSTSAASLKTMGSSLTAQTRESAAMITSAVAYVSSDTRARIAEAASAQASVSEALQLFSSLNISGGAAALAQASTEFQVASSVSA